MMQTAEEPVSVGLVWLAEDRFAGGSAAFGLLFSAWGAGTLSGVGWGVPAAMEREATA